MKTLILTIPLIALCISSGCTEKSKIDVAAGLKPDTMPTMLTRNISTLISDSGVVQYKIVAPVWKAYEETEEPYWFFPEGIYLQKYDRRKKVIATVAADSARFIKNRKLWKLDGHVEIHKEPKDKFFTAQVFWDQRMRKVYSDSFVHIENATHVLEGVGFSADENFREYNLHKPMGIFPIDNKAMTPGIPPDNPVGRIGPATPADPLPAEREFSPV